MMRRRCSAAFSLLELSVVLGIISLIAASGVSLASGALKAADRVQTQERLNTIKLALDSYAKTYGYLPCPYDRTLKTSSADFGVEQRTVAGTACTPLNVAANGLILSGNVYIGGIPVRTLGLPDNYAGDAWGNKLTYAVTDDHVKDPTSYATFDGKITVNYGDKSTASYTYPLTSQRVNIAYSAVSGSGTNTVFTVASHPNLSNNMVIAAASSTAGSPNNGSYMVNSMTGTTITALTPFSGTNDTGTLTYLAPGPGASYVVVSHGPDGRGAFPFSGSAVPPLKLCVAVAANSAPPPCNTSAITSCNDIENCNNDNIFHDTAYNDANNPAQYFDDYIVWGSNAGARVAVNGGMYASCSPTSNPTAGPCETWCATCNYNFPSAIPGGDSTAPPTNLVTSGNPILCSKVLYSNSTDCKASCFWSGQVAAGGSYVKCP